MDFGLDEGMLMAPARWAPRLLARHGLAFADIALFEIHEAFAAQVLANIKAASDPAYRHERAGVDADPGRLSVGATEIHTAAPWPSAIPSPPPARASSARPPRSWHPCPAGSRAIVSVCADGGQGTVALLERV